VRAGLTPILVITSQLRHEIQPVKGVENKILASKVKQTNYEQKEWSLHSAFNKSLMIKKILTNFCLALVYQFATLKIDDFV